jgi:hypothetical protein
MSLEDDVRRGVEKGLNDYNVMQRIEAERAAWSAQLNEQINAQIAAWDAVQKYFYNYTAPRIERLIQDGDYPEAVKIAEKNGGDHDSSFSWKADALKADALWKWGNACDQGSEKYPKDEDKAIELWKGAAQLGNTDAQKAFMDRALWKWENACGQDGEKYSKDEDKAFELWYEVAIRLKNVKVYEAHISKARRHTGNGDYPKAFRMARSLLSKLTAEDFAKNEPYEQETLMTEVMWRWGNACEKGSEKYPKNEAKALELYKGAAWWGNKDAKQTLRQRGAALGACGGECGKEWTSLFGMEAEKKLKGRKQRSASTVCLLIGIPVAIYAVVYGFRSLGSGFRSLDPLYTINDLIRDIIISIAIVAGGVGGGILGDAGATGGVIGGAVTGIIGGVVTGIRGIMAGVLRFSDFNMSLVIIIMFIILAAGGAIVGAISGSIFGGVIDVIGRISARIVYGKRILDKEAIKLLNPARADPPKGGNPEQSGLLNDNYPKQADLLNGDYPDVVKRASSLATGQARPKGDELAILAEALWKWGDACDQGGEKYPKDEAKALELYKGAAWWGNTDAQETLKQRGVPVRVRGKKYKNHGWSRFLIGGASGVGLALLVSRLLPINSFLLRWLVNIAAFILGANVPFSYFNFVKTEEPAFYKDFSLKPLRLVPPPPKKRSKANLVFLVLVLAAALAGWAGFALGFAGINIYDYIRKEQTAR